MEPPSKKARVLLDDSDSNGDSNNSGGVPLNAESDGEFDFQINEAFARRFEYNKKREELQKRGSSSFWKFCPMPLRLADSYLG
jgi:protein KRI1